MEPALLEEDPGLFSDETRLLLPVLKPVFNKNTGYVIDYKGQLKTFSVDRGKILNEYNLNLITE